MKYIRNVCLALWIIGLSGCVFQRNTQHSEVNTLKAYEVHEIALENLETRVVAYCYTSGSISAEECARDMEARGYVRLTDIPKVTADKDFLTTGTYPSRRWRQTDRVPRW